jgi:hypothetical protein
MSGPRDPADVDRSLAHTKSPVFESHPSHRCVSGDQSSGWNRFAPSEIGSDCIAHLVPIQAQTIHMPEGVPHLIYICTKTNDRLL